MNILYSLLVVTAMLVSGGCATNPVTGQQNFVMMSEQKEISLGRQSDAEVRKEYTVYASAALQAYVNEVGQRLAQHSHRPQLAYHFTVLDSPEINAFAVPGGYIYITRGIMAYLSSEAELAAVLAHEIGHVTARHSVQQYSKSMAAGIGTTLASIFIPGLGTPGASDLINVMGNAILSGYGREYELEADRLGAEYIARSNYDPQAMVSVIGVLKNEELFDAAIAKQEGRQPHSYHGVFATHPDADTRLQQVVGEAGKYANTRTEEGRAKYLQQINGLVYGDSPEQGILRNNSFYHTQFNITLKFPSDWRVINLPNKVLARSPGTEATIELGVIQQPQRSLADLLRKNFADALEVNNTQINGLPAAIATGQWRGRFLQAGIIQLNGKAFAVVGSATSAIAFNKYREQINTTINSFHAITNADQAHTTPLKIKTAVATTSSTYAALAKNSVLGKNAESILRLLNHAYPTGEPKPGQLIKTVE